MKHKRWSNIRAAAQLLLWFAFVVIIAASRDTTDNTFFSYLPRISPFLGISISLTAGTIAFIFFPALIFFLASLIFGRFFCGWICPLGATIDFTDKQLAKPKILNSKKVRSIKFWKYTVLLIAVILSAFGLQIAGVIDPVSLSIRSYGTVIFSYVDTVIKIIFNALYFVPGLNVVSEFIFSLLKKYFLDYNQTQYYHHLPVFIFFAGILLLSVFARRFWCRSLCPLGAIYALTGKVAFFKRHVDSEKCTNCLSCEKECRMNAIYDKGERTFQGECVKCFDCLKACRYDAIKFKFSLPEIKRALPALPQENQYDNIRFTRKNLLWSAAGALVAIPILKQKPVFKKDYSRLLRPPGALPEQEFINTCIRCGQCMKVCPTNGLHPVLFEYGADAVFTPQLVPRLGWCEKNCNQCSSVCPTGALKKITIADKETTVIGTAHIVRDICIPWSENRNCLVCEEMCPTKEKSIIFRDETIIDKKGRKVSVKLPYVLEDKCNGCGKCENKCPVQGSAGIIVHTPKRPAKYNMEGYQ